MKNNINSRFIVEFYQNRFKQESEGGIHSKVIK
ncbi:MAG: hypothetical protein K0Q73_1752 [Paenibacillus sp.]|nr:hypothetical protein [Paenibacillus sp.]